MSWGTELWDQYDKIASHTENRIDFVKRVSTFVEKRISVEHSYAKDLRRLVKGFMRKEDEESNYSAVKSFSKMINEVNDLAGQRELISEYLEAEVLGPLKGLARDIATERRKHLANGLELHRHFKAQMDHLERTKKQYEKASEEAETAQHKLEKADNDPNSTKAKIDQFTTVLRQKEQTAEECMNNYILQLDGTNDFRRDHFNQKMPELFAEIQGMNERLINKYKELVAQFAECHRRVFPVINTCLDNITGASESIDAAQDNQQLVVDLKTGFPIPGDVEFEEYMGKQARKSQKKAAAKVEPKEDCSHLPPEQRRRRLQQKVDSIQALITKAGSDRAAMEKMHGIYTQQPSLGDPEAVKKSLEVNAHKIQEYQQDLEKFKAYLADAQRVLEAPPPSKPAKFQPGASKPNQPSPMPSKKNDKKKGKNKNMDKDQEEDQSDEDDSSEASSTVRSPKLVARAPDGARSKLPASGELGGQQDNEEQLGGVGHTGEWSDGEDELNLPGRVLYEFVAQNEEEISVSPGDQIVILEDLQDGWLRVRRRGEEGYVPESYIRKEE